MPRAAAGAKAQLYLLLIYFTEVQKAARVGRPCLWLKQSFPLFLAKL